MRNYVIIDTETSGLFDYSKPADAEGQPRMAQLAILFLAPDYSVQREEVYLIKPDGWVMDAEVAKIHGHTQDLLEANGLPISSALDVYEAVLEWGYVVVGYSVAYDLKILRGELRRAGRPDRFETTKSIDCMHPAARFLKSSTGSGKARKLAICHQELFGAPMPGAHDALVDAHATARIFKHLVNNQAFTDEQLAGGK